MPRSAPIQVVHHTYSRQDAHKTIANISEIWIHHTHESDIPEGWLAGARGFVAEMASLGGVPLPTLDDLDIAMADLTSSLTDALGRLTDTQVESLLAASWRFFPTMRLLNEHRTGTVAHLHASAGLPKAPIARAEVGWRGVKGDVQRSRVHHGRPWQALCLWSTEAIDALRDQGHPIAPGNAGENITVAGIGAGSFRPGAQFRVGGVRGFLTAYTLPCSKNAQWFTDGRYEAMHHHNGPLSRVYAMVTHPGTIEVGDAFELFTDR